MKSVSLKTIFSFILIVGLSQWGWAQKGKSAPRSAYDTSPSSSSYDNKDKGDEKPKDPKANAKTTAKDKKASPATATPAQQKTLPIEVITNDSQEGGLYGVSKPSLRKDNILEDDNKDTAATPLPYTALYASDAMFRVRVWRTIDARTKKNANYFYNNAIEGNDNNRLVNVMLRAIKEDSVQAFSNADDRFTTPISFDEAVSGFGGGKDTAAKYDLEGNIVGYQVRSKLISADSVYKFRIKEEWIFNKRDGKTYVRILGIAPLATYTTSDGYKMDNSEHAVFWIYYPDLRKSLVRSNITNPLNLGGSVTWEEVFENRLFESTILKSTLDAENGFDNSPLTSQQADFIQKQLNNLSKRMWDRQ